MAELFTTADLAKWLKRPLDEDGMGLARRYAAGWLKGATGLQSWPDPVTDPLWSWAIELAGIAYSNPRALVTEVRGAATDSWPLARRAEILAAAAVAYKGGGGGPLFSFPAAVGWPDSIPAIYQPLIR